MSAAFGKSRIRICTSKLLQAFHWDIACITWNYVHQRHPWVVTSRLLWSIYTIDWSGWALMRYRLLNERTTRLPHTRWYLGQNPVDTETQCPASVSSPDSADSLTSISSRSTLHHYPNTSCHPHPQLPSRWSPFPWSVAPILSVPFLSRVGTTHRLAFCSYHPIDPTMLWTDRSCY